MGLSRTVQAGNARIEPASGAYGVLVHLVVENDEDGERSETPMWREDLRLLHEAIGEALA